MKIKEVMEALPRLTNEERAATLANLATHLCSVSAHELLQFQDRWDYSRPFEEFTAAQDEVFKRCLAMELSAFGTATRRALRLEPLDPEMDLV